MNMDHFPLGRPSVDILEGRNKYPFIVNRDFVYLWPGYGHWGPMDVCVPAGYATDLLSIPKLLWPVLSPFGPGVFGSLPHDILYSSEFSLPDQSKKDARAMADQILYDAAIDSGCSKFRAGILFRGVRVGGGFTWDEHNPADVSDDLQSLCEATERWQREKVLLDA